MFSQNFFLVLCFYAGILWLEIRIFLIYFYFFPRRPSHIIIWLNYFGATFALFLPAKFHCDQTSQQRKNRKEHFLFITEILCITLIYWLLFWSVILIIEVASIALTKYRSTENYINYTKYTKCILKSTLTCILYVYGWIRPFL